MSSSHIRSAERVLDILSLVAGSNRPMTTAEIAQELELPKSTAHHLVNVMHGRGFLDYLGGWRLWTIGLSAHSVGAAYTNDGSLHQDVEPYMTELTDKLAITSHLAVLKGTDVVYLNKREPGVAGVRLVTEVGTRLPAHLTAVGRAQLAQLELNALQSMYSRYDWPGRTGAGPTSLASLRTHLVEVQEKGWAVERGNTSSGIACAAAPLMVGSRTLGALGVAFVEGSRTPREIATIAETIFQVTEACNRSLSQKQFQFNYHFNYDTRLKKGQLSDLTDC